MDQITHNVRRNQWLNIVNACQSRTDNSTVREWLKANGMENAFGENTKKLGFGMMRLPELATSGKFGNIDIELTKKMVDYFISEGFTYFDTAWMYCGFKSEDAAGEALVSRHNRNEFTLATKLHSGFFNSEEHAFIYFISSITLMICSKT